MRKFEGVSWAALRITGKLPVFWNEYNLNLLAGDRAMTYVVTENCIKCKYTD